MEVEENEIDHFYEQLQNVLEAVRKHDMLILCGNMNPAVGASNHNRVGIMGAHETGNISDNDGKLVEFCEMNSFVITVTIFPHKEMLKTRKKWWTSPYGRYHCQIDHFLIDKFSRKSVSFCDTKVVWSVYGCLWSASCVNHYKSQVKEDEPATQLQNQNWGERAAKPSSQECLFCHARKWICSP